MILKVKMKVQLPDLSKKLKQNVISNTEFGTALGGGLTQKILPLV